MENKHPSDIIVTLEQIAKNFRLGNLNFVYISFYKLFNSLSFCVSSDYEKRIALNQFFNLPKMSNLPPNVIALKKKALHAAMEAKAELES